MIERSSESDQSFPLLIALGRAIAKKRVGQGFTQTMLADEVGVTRSYLSDVERGLRNVTLNTLDNIANALKTTPGKLLREAEKLGDRESA